MLAQRLIVSQVWNSNQSDCEQKLMKFSFHFQIVKCIRPGYSFALSRIRARPIDQFLEVPEINRR